MVVATAMRRQRFDLRLRDVRDRMLPSLAVRNYRLFWTTNALTSLGISMEMLAQGWLVLEMTDSPFWVGLTAGVRGVGLVGFGAVGGVLADRMNRRDALAFMQVGRIAIVSLLAVLILTGSIELWHVVMLSVFQGVLQALQVPASGALIYDTVGRDLLLNAIAARNASFNVARIVAGVLAALLIGSAGMGACYVGIAAAFTAGLLVLLRIHVGDPTARTRDSMWRNLVDGIAYAAKDRRVKVLLILSMAIEGFGFSHMVLMPVIARDVLGVGVSGLGLLATASGVGAMVGIIGVASLGDYGYKGRLIAVTSAGSGLFLLLFAVSPWFAASLVLVAALNAMLWAFDSTMGAAVQLLATEQMRGRVIGLYSLTWGFTPLGGFLSASVATVVGAPLALGAGAIVVLGYVASVARVLGTVREEPAAPTPPSAPDDQ